MALPDGIHSCGTELHVSTNLVSPAFTEVGLIIEISMSGKTVSSIDFSHLKSPSCAKQKKPGFLDGGQLTFSVMFETVQAAYLDSLLQQYVLFHIIYPDGSEQDFEGFITSLGDQIPFDDRITQDITFDISGRPTFIEA